MKVFGFLSSSDALDEWIGGICEFLNDAIRFAQSSHNNCDIIIIDSSVQIKKFLRRPQVKAFNGGNKAAKFA